MKEKRISFCQGNGSLECNNREDSLRNVDRSRIENNITFIRQDLGEAYSFLFDESTERYNAKQKRNSRKIHGSYFEHQFHQKPSTFVITSRDRRKSFYEDIVQIGNKDDSGIESEDFDLVAECLKEYMQGFQERNPNFYVFNAVLHLDQTTPHLHIDYIPVGHLTQGQDTQNSLSQALYEMGYGKDRKSIARWRTTEVDVIKSICVKHGIHPLDPEIHRESMSVAEYKEYKKIQAKRLEAESELQKLSDLIEENTKLKFENQKLKERIIEMQQ